MKTITIANQKGGVGKTATAFALGAGLAHKGYKILFIDADGQSNLTSNLKASTAPPTIWEVLQQTATAEEAIQHLDKWDAIPASYSLAEADQKLGKNNHLLKEALESIAGNYDYCIIDTPPALGIITTNALTASDSVIIPAQPEEPSIQGIAQFYGVIQAVQEYSNPALKIEGILVTLYRSTTTLHRDYKKNLEATAKELGTKAFKKPIRQNIELGEAVARKTDIYSYAPRSKGAKDYTTLVEEVIKGKP